MSLSADADHRKCGAIPWKNSVASGGPWLWRRCTLTGGYVCQKDPVVVPSSLNSTLTSPSGVAGFLRTPAPDAPYLDNLHYTKNIIAGPGQRIFVFFGSIDVEWQAQCLYDYVELSLSPSGSARTVTSSSNNDKVPDAAGTKSSSMELSSATKAISPIRICGQMENGQRPTIVNNGTIRVMDRNESLQFISSGPELQVTVHTDHSTLGSGFSLRWEILNVISDCGSEELPVVLLVEEGTAR
ncbi:neurogenic locus notch-like, partial [Tropilaelaps mercedesae]